jgi:hypothetical protein
MTEFLTTIAHSALKEHVETCAKHPLAEAMKRIAALEAELKTRPKVPPGWKIMPTEADAAMCRAAGCGDEFWAPTVWTAMAAAAPQPEEVK